MEIKQKFTHFNRLIHKNSRSKYTPVLGAVVIVIMAASALILSQRLINPLGNPNRSSAAIPNVSVASVVEEKVSKNDKVRVIVQLHLDTQYEAEFRLSTQNQNLQRASINSKRKALKDSLGRVPYKVIYEYPSMPFMDIEVSQEALAILKNLRGVVVSVSDNPDLKVEVNESRKIIGADVYQTTNGLGYNGFGMVVAIIDSGIDKSNPFLKDRVVAEACFNSCPNGETQAEGTDLGLPCTGSNSCNHGTLVAGIVSGKINTMGPLPEMEGVAKDATLASLKVMRVECDAAGTCNAVVKQGDVLAALSWVYENRGKYTFGAVNISIAWNKFTAPCDNIDAATGAFKTIVESLKADKIAVVMGTGNDGYVDGINAFSCVSNIIAASASTKTDQIWASSNLGPTSIFPNILLAPGENIATSDIGTSMTRASGTSLATPHIAAAFAMLRGVNINATVDEMFNALKNTGVMIADTRAGSSGTSYPRIQINKAIDYLLSGGANGATASCSGNTGTVTTCAGPLGGTTLGVSDGQVLQATTIYKNLALVTASYRAASNPSAEITKLTYCGIPMTRVGGSAGRSKNIHQTTEMWYLVNPSPGKCDYIATFSSNPEERVLSATIFNNVDSTNPIESFVVSSGAGTGIPGSYTQTKAGPKNSMMECILSSYPNGNANIPILETNKSRQLFSKEGPGKLITANLGSSYQRTADNENMTLSWSTNQIQNFAMTCANIRLAAPIVPTPTPVPPSPPPVTPPPVTTSVDLKVNGSNGPITIANNKTVSLTWTSSNATSCVASNAWTGSKTTSGSFTTPALTADKTFTITCTGSGGSKSDSVSVLVSKLPIVDLKINGSDTSVTFDKGIAPTLAWNQTGATSCTASGGWSGTKALAGGYEKGAVLGNATTYTLTCTNASGSVSDTVSVQTTNNNAPVGYLEKYYTDTNMQLFFGQRVTSRIDYDWGTTGVPMPGMPQNWYSARYSAQITPSLTGTYTFITTSDDGVRLYIDDTTVINNWAYHGRTVDTGTINLVAGRQYDLVMEFVESSGGSTMTLQAGINGGPAPLNPKAVSFTLGNNGGGLTAEYFGSSDFTNLVATVREPVLEQLWVTKPTSLLSLTYRSARYTGTVTPTVGATYTFELSPQTRMWINNVEKVPTPTTNGTGNFNIAHSMAANTAYNLRIEVPLGDYRYFFVRWKYGSQPMRPMDFKTLKPVPGSTAQQPSPPQNNPQPRQSGLKGTYFNSRDLTGNSVTRIDPYIQFYWSGSSPIEGIASSNYSVRWTGSLVVPTDGSYTFYTEADDGMRVTIDGQQVVNKWTWESHLGVEQASNAITLTAGDHAIVVESNQGTGGSKAVLRWSGPGITKRVIQEENLKSSDSLISGARTNYFNNESLTGTSVDTIDSEINFSWGTAAPASGVNADRFSVRWNAIIVAPTAGSYIFYSEADDGIRVWVDGVLQLDHWWWQSHYGAEKASAPITLTAGAHTIKVEAHDGTGGSKAVVRWSGPSTPKGVIPLYIE